MTANEMFQLSQIGRFENIMDKIKSEARRGHYSFEFNGKLDMDVECQLKDLGYEIIELPTYPAYGQCYDGSVKTKIRWNNGK